MWLKHRELSEHEQKLVDMSGKEFDEHMMTNYSEMFKQRQVQEGQKIILPMNFGFEIGPGWRHVLDSLCSKLKIIQDLTGYVCIFDQIKEKYGEARFYYHVENKNDGKSENAETIWSIIDSLVNSHEEYCDYICEELGINIDPNEKVVVGTWYYGSGIEGFKKMVNETLDSADDRIKIAEEYLARKKKEAEIKEKLWDLSDGEVDKVDKIVSEMVEELKG